MIFPRFRPEKLASTAQDQDRFAAPSVAMNQAPSTRPKRLGGQLDKAMLAYPKHFSSKIAGFELCRRIHDLVGIQRDGA